MAEAFNDIDGTTPYTNKREQAIKIRDKALAREYPFDESNKEKKINRSRAQNSARYSNESLTIEVNDN